MKNYDLNQVRHREDLAREEERYSWVKGNCVGKVLEIGCGGAGFLRHLHSRELPDGTFEFDTQTPVWGVDLMWEYIEEARREFPKGNFSVLDITRQPLPYETHEFDTVVLTEVLEHILPVCVPYVLAEAFRVCGGQMLITNPNIEKDDWYASGVLSANHYTIFTRQIWEKFLKPNEKQLAWIRGNTGANHFPSPEELKNHWIGYTKNGNFITVKICRQERFKSK